MNTESSKLLNTVVSYIQGYVQLGKEDPSSLKNKQNICCVDSDRPRAKGNIEEGSLAPVVSIGDRVVNCFCGDASHPLSQRIGLCVFVSCLSVLPIMLIVLAIEFGPKIAESSPGSLGPLIFGFMIAISYMIAVIALIRSFWWAPAN